MKSVIQNHNANLLSDHTSPATARSCNCRQKPKCPLKNKCLSESFVYKGAVSQSPSQINKHYYKTSEKTFKEWYKVILLHLGIKADRKLRNSLRTCGN